MLIHDQLIPLSYWYYDNWQNIYGLLLYESTTKIYWMFTLEPERKTALHLFIHKN